MATTQFYINKKATAKRWCNALNAEGYQATMTDMYDRATMANPPTYRWRVAVSHPDLDAKGLNQAIYEVKVKYTI